MKNMQNDSRTKILEINLISAQGLRPPHTNLGRFQTYAVIWADSAHKLRTRVDNVGSGNPTWNDKFLFRVTPEFLSSETSGVCVDIYSVGHFRDSIIGSVRLVLGNCLGINVDSGGCSVQGTPAFTAVLIQRPSGKFEGVLNFASALYGCEDFKLMSGLSAVCFRDLTGGEKWRRRLSRIGSRQSEKSSGGESCEFDVSSSMELSDGNESTTSSSSAASTILKEWNGVRDEIAGKYGAKDEMAGKYGAKDEMAGKYGVKPGGGGMLCGLLLQKRIPFSPSDKDLRFWAESFEKNGDQQKDSC